MARWIISEKKEIPKFSTLSLHHVVMQLLFLRGISKEKEMREFISPSYEKDCHDPFLFAEMEKVVERIKIAKEKREKIAIFGDYDADGVTASIILKETLDELGIKSVTYIPDKLSEGYGMNIEAIEKIKKKNVSLIITVDCGITNITEVEKAKSLGIDVIITDHHHVPDVVPKAYSIINPHARDSKYPFKELAGVGVAFKVAQAVYKKLIPEKYEQTKWMLDLVAIGTIADCVPLIGENRLFAKYGLIVLSKTRRAGLKELFNVGRMIVDEKNIPDTKKVSFYIAPRINAAGRIKHANLAFDLIKEKNVAKAREFALEIEAHNTERQKITEKVVEEVRILAQNMYKEKKFIFAAGEHFPMGVLGLAAGKIVQEFSRPAAIFQKKGGISVGSFRSIPKLNIIEIIQKCGDLLEKFGGHAQAAGASVKNENLEKFYEKMDSLIGKELDGFEIVEEILVDSELGAEDLDFKLLDDLEKLRPFGEGNREPVFLIKNLIVREKKIVGNGNKHVKLFLSREGVPKIFEAISFNGYEKHLNVSEKDKVDILCNVQKDEWNGKSKIQLTLVDLKLTIDN